MIGNRYGKLVVKELSDVKVRGKGRNWICFCDCGKECIKTTSELNSGCGKSCGCINTKHKMSTTRQYMIWHDMGRRCDQEQRSGYENYGGRGISYDPKWTSFEGFWEDMSEGYSDEMELERLNVNLDYCKDNCEWVLDKEQAKNKRKYKNNKLGIGNISIILHRGIETIKVRVQESETKKRHVRTFSLNIYTYEEALKLAEDWLTEKRKEFGYKESHGT